MENKYYFTFLLPSLVSPNAQKVTKSLIKHSKNIYKSIFQVKGLWCTRSNIEPLCSVHSREKFLMLL
jgi:hypothetical protein